jgi:HPt (histidine-containing phosphotransfer) domain-containing protein
MLTETLKTLYSRDLLKLKQELELYNNEDNIWRVDKTILNSAGNLSLHLIGNLNTYIGAELGNTGYIRNRPEEFSLKNVPRQELISKIERTIEMIDATLSSLTEDQLKSEYPQLVADDKVLTEYFLVHLATHLSYHLGQVNYHRRLLDD